MPFASTTPTAGLEGARYSNAVPLTSTEAELGNTDNDLVPANGLVPVDQGQTVVAIVKFTVSGHLTGNSTFVFLQTDFGDGTWVDVAWCYFNANQGTATFILSGGGLGAMNNAFEFSRDAGAAPATQANGSNAIPLGGRIRFTGFHNSVGGSSGAAELESQVTADIYFKIQKPR